jgi:hypothetical protein
MGNIKFIPNHMKNDCWRCSKRKVKGCKLCHGTGKFIEYNWHLIYITKEGKKMGFSVDGLK